MLIVLIFLLGSYLFIKLFFSSSSFIFYKKFFAQEENFSQFFIVLSLFLSSLKRNNNYLSRKWKQRSKYWKFSINKWDKKLDRIFYLLELLSYKKKELNFCWSDEFVDLASIQYWVYYLFLEGREGFFSYFKMNCSLGSVNCKISNQSSITAVINETLIGLISCNDTLSLCNNTLNATSEPEEEYIKFR